MSEIPAIQKQLKIKSGTVQRYEKELSFYRKEVEDLGKKLDKFIAQNAEEWDIKNTNKMIDESKKMVVDTEKKLEKATGDLKDLVQQVKDKPALAETEELKKALQIVGM